MKTIMTENYELQTTEKKDVVAMFKEFSDELVALKELIKSKSVETVKQKNEITISLNDIGQLRRDIEARRKKVNAPALAYTKFVNGHTQALDVSIREIETDIKQKLQRYANKQAAILAEIRIAEEKSAVKAREDLRLLEEKKRKEAAELERIEAEKQAAIQEKIEAEKAKLDAIAEKEEFLFMVDQKTLDAEDKLKELEAARMREESMAKERAMQQELDRKTELEAAKKLADDAEQKQIALELEEAEQEYRYVTTWDIINLAWLPACVFENRKKEIKKAIAPEINRMIKAGMKEISGISITINKELKV